MTRLSHIPVQGPYSGGYVPERALLYCGLILLASLLIGWWMLYLANRQDRKGWIFARAPRLPIRLLSVHDDAWIRGIIRCDAPLRCPWFGLVCVWYSYVIEVKRTRRVRDSKGRTRTESYWATEHSESEGVPFEIEDEGASIGIRAQELSVSDSRDLGTDYEWGSRRHSAHALPLRVEASVLGVMREGGDFGTYKEVPLLLTLRDPASFIESSDSKERWLRRSGYFLISLGGFAATALFMKMESGGPEWWIAVLAALLFVLPFWFASTYNRFVRRGQQVQAAWSQVDVDLAPRDRLIPDLASVIKGLQEHERDLFAQVARLRAGGTLGDRVKNDQLASSVAQRIFMLKEAWPDLTSNQLFLDYHDRLWALEEKLAVSRNLYNKVVREWNDLVDGFPTLLLARLFGHRPHPYFE